MKFTSGSLKLAALAILCFYILMGISCTFASDVNDATLNNESNVDDISVPVNASNETLQEDENVLGNFDDLNNDIQNLCPGEVYNIDKNYKFGGEINPSKKFITSIKTT